MLLTSQEKFHIQNDTLNNPDFKQVPAYMLRLISNFTAKQVELFLNEHDRKKHEST